MEMSMRSLIHQKDAFDSRFFLVLKSGILFCFLAHTFGITNALKNNDSIQPSIGYGHGITSGRHFLTLIGEITKKLFGIWNLNFFNNIVALTILIFVAFLIVTIYDIKNKKLIVLWTGIFVTFPTVTSTLFYSFTSHFYALAIFLGVLAVYYSENYKNGYIISIVLGAISLGIYQAYYPMIISMYVLLLIKPFLNSEKEIDLRFIVKKSFFYLFILITMMILYYITLKLALKFSGLELTTYHGIDEMFVIQLEPLSKLIMITYNSILLIPLRNIYGLSSSPAISFCVICLMLVSTFLYLNIVMRQKKILNRFAIIFLFVITPIATNFIIIMTKNVGVNTMQVYSLVFLFLLPIIYIDNVNTKPQINIIICICISVIILGYSYFSNVNYAANYHTVIQTQNFYNQVVTRVKHQDGFSEDLKWIFVGDVDYIDKRSQNPWAWAMTYRGNSANSYHSSVRSSWIYQYLGYIVPEIRYDDYIKSIKYDAETLKMIDNMPNYPNDGSIFICDKYVIIKFSDE
jgi:hypothetical protein